MSNELEQFEFKLEKIIGILETCRKVRKALFLCCAFSILNKNRRIIIAASKWVKIFFEGASLFEK